jgi:hypothetical protein
MPKSSLGDLLRSVPHKLSGNPGIEICDLSYDSRKIDGPGTLFAAFAAAMFSLEPNRPIWAKPTFVITPTSGHAILESAAISPGARMAISTTATWCSGASSISVKGTPISLFILPDVAITLNPADSTDAIMSFVVVLPALPVTPTTLARMHLLCRPARDPRARRTSSTNTSPNSARSCCSQSGTLKTTAPLHPLAAASSTKSCPSTRSPGRAKKIAPGSAFLVSIATDFTRRPGSPRTRLPPVASAICLSV